MKQIQLDLLQEQQVTSTRAELYKTLKKDLSYKFAKVKKLPRQANSIRSLYYRMEFARVMIKYLQEGKRILNI